MTLNDLWPKFRGHDIIQREVTRKWYKVELCLQWRTNRKSYYGLSNSAIFNDLVSKFQGHAIFDAEYLRNGTIYRHSFNGILIGTYILTVSFRMTLSDLAKYSMTRSVTRSLCDSWASCCSTREALRHGSHHCVLISIQCLKVYCTNRILQSTQSHTDGCHQSRDYWTADKTQCVVR